MLHRGIESEVVVEGTVETMLVFEAVVVVELTAVLVVAVAVLVFVIVAFAAHDEGSADTYHDHIYRSQDKYKNAP